MKNRFLTVAFLLTMTVTMPVLSHATPKKPSGGGGTKTNANTSAHSRRSSPPTGLPTGGPTLTSAATSTSKLSAAGSTRTAPTGANRSSTAGTSAPSASRQPAGSHMSPTQQGNAKQLQTDMSGIKQGSQVTQGQKDALKNSLTAMADGATKPDPALTQQLANDLSGALADGSVGKKEQSQLANDLSAVMNSANIPMSEVNQAASDAQAILVSSGVSKSDAQAVAKDMQAIATEAQKNAANGAAQVQSRMSTVGSGPSSGLRGRSRR